MISSSLRGLGMAIAVGAPVLLLISWLVAHVLEQQQRSAFEARAVGEARSVLLTLPDDLAAPMTDDLSRALRRPAQLEVVILDSEGGVGRSSDRVDAVDIPADIGRWSADQPLKRWVSLDDDSVLLVGGAKRAAGPAILLYFSQESLVEERDQSHLVLAIAAGILLILIAFAGWALSYRQLRSMTATRDRERAFTAHVGHELRTPVGTLVAAASLVDDKLLHGCADAVREPVVLMQTEARRLRHIVENLLELSRLETGQVQTRLEHVDVNEIIRTTIASYGWTNVRLRADRVGLALTDRHSLARIVMNLISNSIRHGGNEATVTVRQEGDNVVVEVADDGPGMPPERVNRLLREDRRKTTSAWSDPGVGGLGLLIALAHVRLVNAQMEIDTGVEVGTTIRVRLPLARHRKHGAPPLPLGHRAQW